MPNIILIRPGCTDYNEQNRIQGELDLPLNERGRNQLGPLVEQLRSLPIELILTAPSEPARSTAEFIGDEIGAPVKEASGLRNLNQGLWQGLTIEEVRRKYPRVYKQWQESPETICPPDGETITEALERIQKVLQKAKKRKTDVALIVSEPLASLICCVVKGCNPELPATCTNADNTSTIEILISDNQTDFDPKKTVEPQTAVSTQGEPKR